MGDPEVCLRSEAPSCRGIEHSMMTNVELSAVRAFWELAGPIRELFESKGETT